METKKLDMYDILLEISDNGGFCNISRMNVKEIAHMIHEDYECTWPTAYKVARAIIKGWR